MEVGGKLHATAVKQAAHARTEFPAFLQLILARTAQQVSNRRPADRPRDTGGGFLSSQLRELEQRVERGVAAADDEHAAAGVAAPLGAEHVGNAVEDAVAGGGLADRAHAGSPERTGRVDRSRRVNDRTREEVALAVGAKQAQEEGGVLAPAVLHPIVMPARDRQHARAQAKVRRDLR